MNAGKKIILTVGLVVLGSGLFGASQSELRSLYSPLIDRAARTYIVDAALIHAVIQAESNYERFAISEKGAMGLMQLMPATAAQYGVKNVFDAAQNIEGGTKYLKDLMNLFKNETKRVLAAYNAGQEAVRRYGGIPPYQETIDYIARVPYKMPYINNRKPIYKFLDAEGHWVLTDDPNYNQSKKAK